MRLLSRNEAPSEDTPPSTRPSSAASSSTSGPQRSTSMDSIHTSSSISDKPIGEEIIPTRFTRSSPKVNVNASMQFVKTKPPELYKKAKDQISKVESLKNLRKTAFQEEEEWQFTTQTSKPLSEDQDWQSNLDSWKNNRRKRNEEVLERVIAVKKYEQEEEYGKERRRGKTFSEMQQEKNKRGRRYNFALNDDDNDLSELGIEPSSKSSVDEFQSDSKDIDNKDAKSDAGFCTGSDTGSDGVFAEDNSSDTSSALGDKKEQSDSLIEPSSTKPEVNGILPQTNTNKDKITEMSIKYEEYTFEKALDKYKEYAESSTKRSPSVTSLSSTSSFSKEDKKDEKQTPRQFKVKTKKFENFREEMSREERIVPRAKSIGREKPQKVDIKKRRSMFELRDIDNESKGDSIKSYGEISKTLLDRVSSFENVNSDSKSYGIVPPRDAKFKEKLAAFNKISNSVDSSVPKRIPERDQNFYKKLENFSKIEDSEKPVNNIIKKKPNETISKYLSKEKANLNSESREKSISTEYLHNSSYEKEEMKRSPSTPYLVVNVDSNSEVRHRENKIISDNSNRKTVYEQFEKVELKRDINTDAVSSFFNNFNEKSLNEAKNNNLIEEFNHSQNVDSNPLNETVVNKKETFSEVQTSFESVSNFSKLDPMPSTNSDYLSSSKKLFPIPNINFDQFSQNNKTEVLSSTEPSKIKDCSASQKEYSSSKKYYEKEDDSLDVDLEEYGDSDIDEAIRDFSNSPLPKTNKDVANHFNQHSTQNTYENIKEDDQTYENIYEKIDEPLDFMKDNDIKASEHLYQTLDEVQEDLKELAPVIPPKKPACFTEVLDMTWTEDGCRASLALPPSVPPPPPPEEEDAVGEFGADCGLDTRTPHVSSYPKAGVYEDISLKENNLLESNNARIDGKKEIMMKRSTFLGTNPYVAQEPSIKPPPDIKDLLRQERDAERQLLQAKREQAELDNISNRSKYTWEDRLRDDSANLLDISDSSSQFDFQFKLEELELEMEKHDRDMLQRIKPSETKSKEENLVENPQVIQKPPSHQSAYTKTPAKSTSSLPIQEFYTAPSNEVKPNKDSELTEKHYQHVENKVNEWPASRILPPNPHPPAKPSRSLAELSLSAQPFQKPSMKTLSAIPKPKRNDSESWIAKRKADNGKRSYTNHWLIQEAEQRRLDSTIQQQQQNIPPKSTYIPPPSNYSTNVQQPFKNPSLYNYNEQAYVNNSVNQTSPEVTSVNHPVQNLVPNNSSLYANMSQNNIYSNPMSKSQNETKPQGITYTQPLPPVPQPPPQKSLPESIINSITQRVTNKNRNQNQNNDRTVNYNSRYQNHDYMNSEEILRSQQEKLETKPSQIPVKQSSVNNNSGTISPPNEEQRLLSVSGKKKCSHCCEELGRGAAMIIESLRLFYHIPCFKCCVCGIQLGNGTSGADVRVRNHKLHCHNCYSNDEGMKFSKV